MSPFGPKAPSAADAQRTAEDVAGHQDAQGPSKAHAPLPSVEPPGNTPDANRGAAADGAVHGAPRGSTVGRADPVAAGRALAVVYLALKNLRHALDRNRIAIALMIPPAAEQSVLRLVREEADEALKFARPLMVVQPAALCRCCATCDSRGERRTELLLDEEKARGTCVWCDRTHPSRGADGRFVDIEIPAVGLADEAERV